MAFQTYYVILLQFSYFNYQLIPESKNLFNLKLDQILNYSFIFNYKDK